MYSILKFLIVVIKIKFVFFPPLKKSVLLYDNDGNELASKIFKNNTYSILHTRKESLNVLILLITLIKGKFNTFEYYKNYVNYVSPKIVITFNDNNLDFYELKKKINAHFISVQRGYRTYHNDILQTFKDKNEIYRIDHYFVFNESIKNHLKKYLDSKFTLLGSIENNFHALENKINKNREIVYISSHAVQGFNKLVVSQKEKLEFYKIELDILNKLINYCEKNNYKFSILAKHRNKKNKRHERNFFENGLVGNFNYIENYHSRNTYKILDSAFLSIGTHSTVLYENFSRGNRSFVFNFRHEKYPFNTKAFGYFSKRPPHGEIWYIGKNIDFVLKKITKILGYDHSQWLEILRKYESDTCQFNFGNSLLKDYLKKNLLNKDIVKE